MSHFKFKTFSQVHDLLPADLAAASPGLARSRPGDYRSSGIGSGARVNYGNYVAKVSAI